MNLDSLRLASVVVQVKFPHAFELWDHAGSLARGLVGLWPELEVARGEPNEQLLRAPGVNVLVQIDSVVLTLSSIKVIDGATSDKIVAWYEMLSDRLSLSTLERVSARIRYTKDYPTLQAANKAMLDMGLVRMPSEKVFDQPQDGSKNALDVSYRFEDDESFAVLRVRAEAIAYTVQLDTEYVDEPEIKKERRRLVVEFDRGVLRKTDARTFKMADFLKGYMHVLRRDVGKVLGGVR